MVEFMELPTNNVAEIISKLPIKTILACRCACKSLLDLTFFNRYFTALHSEQHTTQQISSSHLIIQFRDSKHLKNYVQLIDALFDTKPIRSTAPKLRLSPIFKVPIEEEHLNYNKFALVNACNGLIYFAIKSSERCSSLVCNPITKEHVRVPEVDRLDKQTSSSWLGFSPVSRMYKVLRFYNYTNGTDNGAHIHDVGCSSNSWRDVKSTPLNHIYWNNSYAFLNRIGYWLCRFDDQLDHRRADAFLLSFDFESEIFGMIDIPPSFDSNYRLRFTGIGIIENCLCLIDNVWSFNIWMMDNCGKWNKKFTYDDVFAKPLDICQTMLRPLQMLSSGEILMVSDNRHLVCYDTKRNNFRFLDLHMMKPNCSVVTFVPSFVSFKDMLLLSNKG